MAFRKKIFSGVGNKETEMKTWKKGQQTWPAMGRRAVAGSALIIALAVASCSPVMDTVDFEKAKIDVWETPDGTYLTLKPEGEQAPGASASTRSLTAEQQDNLWNYYEVIAKKVARLPENWAALVPQSWQTQFPPDWLEQVSANSSWVWPDIGDDIWYSVRGSRKSGWVSIPVDVNFVYDVLLLEGYQDPAKPNEPPVLLRSAYVRTLPIHEGQNESNVIYQRALVQPDNDTDNEAGLRVFLTDGGVRPNYQSGELTLYLPKNPVPAQNPRVTMAIDGIAPLIMAKNSADSAALINPNTAPDFKKLNGVTFTEFFTGDSKMTREELRVVGEESRVYPAWHHGAENENLDSGTVDGRALTTWKIEPSSTLVPFLPPVDGKTSLFFDVYYYAFSVTPADDPATAVFKRWVIRNGLDNVNTDKESGVVGYTTTGGMVTVVIGTGGASGGGTVWAPGSGGATYLFSRPPALVATVGPANQGVSTVTYTVQESDPRADSYKLYWARTDDDGEPYSSSVWHEAVVQDGTFPVSGDTEGCYTLVVQAIKDKYTSVYSSKIRKTSTSLRIALHENELGGGPWDFTPATGVFNLNESEEYRIVSDGSSLDRKIHVAPNLGNVTLIMGEGVTLSDIILTGVPALAIEPGSNVTIKLSDGITVKLGSSAGSGQGVLVPQTASLTIETNGTLGNGALYAQSADGRPAIGGGSPSGDSGEITINSGNIYANGGSGAAALGSGNGLVRLMGGRVSVQLVGGTAIGHNNQGSVRLNGGALLTVSGTGSPFSLGASGSQWNEGVVQIVQANTNTTIYGSQTLPNVLFTNNALTVENGDTLTVSGASTSAAAAPTPAAGITVTIPSTMKVINKGLVTVSSGTLSGTLDNNANGIAGRVTVDGGTLSGTLTNTGIITMTGGTLSGTVDNANGWINTTTTTAINVNGGITDLDGCGGIVFVDDIGYMRTNTELAFDVTIESTKRLNILSGTLANKWAGSQPTQLRNRGTIILDGRILGNTPWQDFDAVVNSTGTVLDNQNGVIFARTPVAESVNCGGGILFKSSTGTGTLVGANTTLGAGLELEIPADTTLTIPNGKKLTASGGGGRIKGVDAATSIIEIESGGTLEFSGGEYPRGEGRIIKHNGGMLTGFGGNQGWTVEPPMP
jgi:hypothetical protein